MKKRKYRGKWGSSGLTSITIAALMGVNVTKAKRVLYALKEHFGKAAHEDDDLIGMTIQEVRNREELKRLKRCLDGR